MSNVTLTQIKKEVKANGGSYEKFAFRLNGQPAYEVNGKVMTKTDMIERFKRGEL